MIFVFTNLPSLGHHEPVMVVQTYDIVNAVKILAKKYEALDTPLTLSAVYENGYIYMTRNGKVSNEITFPTVFKNDYDGVVYSDDGKC